MSSSPDVFEDREKLSERRAERPAALTQVHEQSQGDGYRWASLDVVDLDPPTWFPER
jgi:hypothetical protein